MLEALAWLAVKDPKSLPVMESLGLCADNATGVDIRQPKECNGAVAGLTVNRKVRFVSCVDLYLNTHASWM